MSYFVNNIIIIIYCTVSSFVIFRVLLIIINAIKIEKVWSKNIVLVALVYLLKRNVLLSFRVINVFEKYYYYYTTPYITNYY